MSDIRYCGTDLGSIVTMLTGKQINGVHLDPDLRYESRPRKDGWLPMFGQTDTAQTHLEKNGVGVGDVFLFFGWFRQTAWESNVLKYASGAEDVHVIFGWLQIGEIFKPSREKSRIPEWACEHPHVSGADVREENNTLYVASPRLNLPGLEKALPGGGAFPRLAPALRLTAHGHTRSIWLLPAWFYPCEGRLALSCHSKPTRWSRDSTGVLLESVGRGQEFVLDCGHYPESFAWLKDIFANA
jgi:hypothetical protein